MVDNTETSLESHGDGHLVLSDGVHRRGDKWSLEGDALGDWRVEGDGGGWEANVAWEDEEVVVGEASILMGVEELGDIESITDLVLVLEDLQGRGSVEDLLALGKAQASWNVTVGERHY